MRITKYFNEFEIPIVGILLYCVFILPSTITIYKEIRKNPDYIKKDKEENFMKNFMFLFISYLVMTIICCIFYNSEYALNVTSYLFGLLFSINMVIIMGHISYSITISLLVAILLSALALVINISLEN